MNRSIDISPWIPPPMTPKPAPQKPHRTMSPTVVGLIGTLLVHVLVLQTMVLGYRANKVHPPDRQGAGAAQIQSGAEPMEDLILINIPQTAAADQSTLNELASRGQAMKNPLVTIISADALPHVEIPPDAVAGEAAPETALTSGDPLGQAKLFGMYTGQIHARIERAWRRPRTPIFESSDHRSADQPFRCQVQIVQDLIGNVQEVLLPNCPGSFAWQRSLVVAIQQSSPLPAPPDPSVFNRTIGLEFMGFSYGPGGEESEYEVPSRAALNQQ